MRLRSSCVAGFGLLLSLIGCGPEGGEPDGGSAVHVDDGDSNAGSHAGDDAGDAPTGGGASQDAASAGDGDGDGGAGNGNPTPRNPDAAYRLVYWGDFAGDGTYKLVVVDSSTGDERSVDLEGTESNVAVSPDGRFAAVVADDTTLGERRVLLHDLDDLTSPVTVEDGTQELFGYVSFSPDSKRLVYTAEVYVTAYEDELRIVTLDALDRAPKTLPLNADISDAELAWSPGGMLAISIDVNTGTAGVYVASVDEGGAGPDDDVWSLTAFDAPCDPYDPATWRGDAELYCVGTDAIVYVRDVASGMTAPLMLSGLDSVADILVSPDGKWMAIAAAVDVDAKDDVFMLSFEQSTLEQWTDYGTIPAGGDTVEMVWRSDSLALLVAIEWENALLPGISGSLAEMAIDATAMARQVDAPMTAWQVEATDMMYTPDVNHVYLRADARSESEMELLVLDDLDVQTPNVDDLIVQSAAADTDVDGFAVMPIP